MGLEIEDFSDEDQCQCMYTWEFLVYFFPYHENSHPENSNPENFHQSNSPLVNFHLENSHPETATWNIPIHSFKYSHTSFLFFSVFSLFLPLSLILLQRLFCNSKFQQCWSFYVCENLSKWKVKWRKTVNEMGGNIPGENFLGGNFPRGNLPGGSLMGGNSSYNVSILIFQKIINKYNMTFNKKIYILNS